jgi:hypothetical protein
VLYKVELAVIFPTMTYDCHMESNDDKPLLPCKSMICVDSRGVGKKC